MGKLASFIFLFFATALLSAPSHSWELSCSADDFTDEKRCNIQRVEGSFVIFIGLSDDERFLIFSVGDLSSNYSGEFMLRIDDNDARDLKEEGNPVAGRLGAVFVLLNRRDGKELIQEMADGERIRVRLSPFDSARQTVEFTSTGLGDLWAEFKKETGY